MLSIPNFNDLKDVPTTTCESSCRFKRPTMRYKLFLQFVTLHDILVLKKKSVFIPIPNKMPIEVELKRDNNKSQIKLFILISGIYI